MQPSDREHDAWSNAPASRAGDAGAFAVYAGSLQAIRRNTPQNHLTRVRPQNTMRLSAMTTRTWPACLGPRFGALKPFAARISIRRSILFVDNAIATELEKECEATPNRADG
jgi:hypothetical protein